MAKESFTLLAPDGQANIIASSEPLDRSIETRQYADVQGDLLAQEFPDYFSLSYESALVFGRRPGYIRTFTWKPPDGVPVTQIQAYYARDGRGYTATATTPSERFEDFEADFRRVLLGMTLDGDA
jgi:hypothetical protein